MPQQIEKLAVLFADICGSTALYDKLGDDVARKLVARCLQTMAKSVPTFQGAITKTIGDEIMAIFPNAEAAFFAACAMQTAVSNDQPLDGTPLFIRVGFNYGDVIKESNDVFGNTVNVAARVTAITRAGQIMATQEVFDALPAELQKNMRLIMRAEFKGKQDHQAVYQILCEQDDTEATRCGIPAYRKSPDNNDEVTLWLGEVLVKVCKGRRSVSLGRGDICDITVHSDLASRMHTLIELRLGKFYIADQSTNGTYIRFSDGSVVSLTRQEIRLKGSGVISLGQAFADEPEELIEFSISAQQA